MSHPLPDSPVGALPQPGLDGAGDDAAQRGPGLQDQYKYRPWLVESFVDSEFFAGTCYQAAN